MLQLLGENTRIFPYVIQNARESIAFIRRMQDGGAGSNASLPINELDTKLTRRQLSFQLFPFSFRELLAYKKSRQDVLAMKSVTITVVPAWQKLLASAPGIIQRSDC